MKLLFSISICLFIFEISVAQKVNDTLDATELLPYQLLDKERNTSLISIIANPEKYNNKRVQVIGYLNLDFEGNAIYLHKEDYLKHISQNGLWVEFSKNLVKKVNLKLLNNNYVILLGTFRAEKFGHLGLFGGTIEDIVRIGKWE